jgi:type III pantothenate kinase
MRLITVDNGNTHPHVGVFVDSKLESVIPLREFTPLAGDIVIAASVGNKIPFPINFSVGQIKSKLSMEVHYSETLGEDRLVCGYGVYKSISNKDEKVLLIDAGTFLTADLISAKGFEGGFIFPGVKTYLASYQRGHLLPSLEFPEEILNIELAHNTQDAILGAAEIYLESIIDKVITKTSPSRIVLTGGSSLLVQKILEKINLRFPLNLSPHLIHLSLKLIHEEHLLPKE